MVNKSWNDQLSEIVAELKKHQNEDWCSCIRQISKQQNTPQFFLDESHVHFETAKKFIEETFPNAVICTDMSQVHDFEYA